MSEMRRRGAGSSSEHRRRRHDAPVARESQASDDNSAGGTTDDLRQHAAAFRPPQPPPTPPPTSHVESAFRRATADERMSINPARDLDRPRGPMASNNNAAAMDGALPEDDGMRALRQKLQEIKELAVSTEEKALKMHLLMMQDYAKHRGLGHPTPPDSPEPRGHDHDGLDAPILGAAALPIDPRNPYNLRPGDVDPVYSPLPKAPRDVEGDGDEAMVDDNDDEPDLGCMHYKRNVKVQCFDCQRWFPCRHCHDQAKDLPFSHALNRQKTQNMLCMICQTPQPAAHECIACGNYAAWYYCSKCKLWDNDTNKRIYHCDDCGICRVGEGLGKDFVHCKRCNVCISISTSAAHPCIERATEGNCPLCLMRMFEAKVPVVSLPCGHYMHGDCYKDLMAVTYRCPVCSKSAVNMELQWRKLDEEIAMQPMPDDEDLEGLLPHVEATEEVPEQVADTNDTAPISPPRRPRTVWIGCNDCGARTWSPFHWLGLKCQRCDSYNTNQMTPTAHHETEAERLLRQQTQSVFRHDFAGNDVLRDAGIGMPVEPPETTEIPPSALEVPESPSQQPTSSSSPRLAVGAQSPGRYFVTNEEIRRPSFSGRFSAPSMPNLPTLSNLPDIPRMPRMPTLPNMPNLETMRQNLPNMPNVEFAAGAVARFSPYEMMDAVTRSLSPMRYYLRGLDIADGEVGEEGGEAGTLPQHLHHRPGSVYSDSAAIPRRGSKLRSRSDVEGVDLLGSGRVGEDGVVGDSSEEEEEEEEADSAEEDDEDEDEDTEMLDDDDDDGDDMANEPRLAGRKKDQLEFEIFGHR